MKLFSNTRLLFKEWFPDKTSVLYFIFAIIVALVYWGITVTEEKENKTFAVSIKFSHVPRDFAVVGPDVQTKINVEVAALSDILKKIGEEDIELTIDAGRFTSGPLVYELTENDLNLPSSVSFVRVFPKILQLQLDKKITSRIMLKPQFVGRADNGKQVAFWKIEPPSLEAEGPQSVIEATKYIPTQPIPLTGRRENFSIPVVPISDDPEISIKIETSPVLSVTLGEKKTQKVIKGVPVFVARLLPNIEAQTEPKEITVVIEGAPQVIDNISPDQLFAQIDVGGLAVSDASYKLKPAVQLKNGSKNGCEVVSSSPPFVEVLLKERR
jgi:YbbR domain-containing protein